MQEHASQGNIAKLLESGQTDVIRCIIDNIDLNDFTYSRLETCILNYENERFDASIIYAGLAIEEELANKYAKEVPKKYPPYKRNCKEVSLLDMRLYDLIKWAFSIGLLDEKTANNAHAVRKARDFVAHAYVIMRKKFESIKGKPLAEQLMPDDIEIPCEVMELMHIAKVTSVPKTLGRLESKEGAAKVVELTIEVLKALSSSAAALPRGIRGRNKVQGRGRRRDRARAGGVRQERGLRRSKGEDPRSS